MPHTAFQGVGGVRVSRCASVDTSMGPSFLHVAKVSKNVSIYFLSARMDFTLCLLMSLTSLLEFVPISAFIVIFSEATR